MYWEYTVIKYPFLFISLIISCISSCLHFSFFWCRHLL
jgi:hypothetical protein